MHPHHLKIKVDILKERSRPFFVCGFGEARVVHGLDYEPRPPPTVRTHAAPPPWSVIRTRRSRITHMRASCKRGTERRDKVRKSAENCRLCFGCWAPTPHSCVGTSWILGAEQLFHKSRRDSLDQTLARAPPWTTTVRWKLCSTPLCIMSGARRVLLGRRGQVPGHTQACVSGDSGPLCGARPPLPRHQHLLLISPQWLISQLQGIFMAWMKWRLVWGGPSLLSWILGCVVSPSPICYLLSLPYHIIPRTMPCHASPICSLLYLTPPLFLWRVSLFGSHVEMLRWLAPVPSHVCFVQISKGVLLQIYGATCVVTHSHRLTPSEAIFI